MLYALVFELVAHNDGMLPANTGKLTHGLFFNIIRSIDRDVATALHNRKERQPFSLSPLHHPRMKIGRPYRVKAGYTFEMRVALLNDSLFDSVIAFFTNKYTLPMLYVGEIDLEITAIHTTGGSHPRAGYTTHEALRNRWDDATPLPTDVTLYFRTPTAISRGKDPRTKRKRYWLFPEPLPVWHNLRRQWGYTGGDDPGKAFDAWIEKHIQLVSHRLQTHILDFDRFQQRGFTGSATFRCVGDPDRADHAFWLALCAFSFYAGIGYKTSAGFGQVAPKIHRPKWADEEN